ncbi:MAG TPA: N-acetyltransferase family protein [Roseiflexaceae bacterium]|nr:N-acetyltransferase family protein [Roseiflexaceae bacterium]HMP41699.1 N-acetyltransferase family protein [Roseiflexaceae bacterium]
MDSVLRLATAADAGQIAAIYAPFCETSTVSFETVAPSPAVMAQRIATIGARWPWLVLQTGDRVAGYVYAGQHRERAAYQWAVDVTAYVATEYRRRHVGQVLYHALFRLLVLQGYFKAYAGITIPNPASLAFHESLGFRRIGIYHGVGYKLGAWRDVAWYERELQPERHDPVPPRPIDEIMATQAGKIVLRVDPDDLDAVP